ncbi:MAG: hypothetical protein NXI12_08030 [Alphaproteobacteria bacterium]|nr:hypothetical protein [Alphaproteobacteria bacterium]
MIDWQLGQVSFSCSEPYPSIYDGFDRISQIDYAHPTVPGTNTGNDDEIFTYDSVGRLSSRRCAPTSCLSTPMTLWAG